MSAHIDNFQRLFVETLSPETRLTIQVNLKRLKKSLRKSLLRQEKERRKYLKKYYKENVL